MIKAYGLCFGAKKIVQAAHLELFNAVVVAHPSFFQPEDADNISVPIALMPSDGEDKAIMDQFWARIEEKSFADKCYRENFVCIIRLDFAHG
jgi:dienelactone hydrolase